MGSGDVCVSAECRWDGSVRLGYENSTGLIQVCAYRLIYLHGVQCHQSQNWAVEL